MSYHTNVDVMESHGRPELKLISERVRSYLQENQDRYAAEIEKFVVDQFRSIFKNSEGDIKGFSSDEVGGVIEFVSAGFPGVIFRVRGIGESFEDVWLRVILDGQTILRIGPFGDEVELALRPTQV